MRLNDAEGNSLEVGMTVIYTYGTDSGVYKGRVIKLLNSMIVIKDIGSSIGYTQKRYGSNVIIVK